MTVVIENDGLDTLDESIKPRDIESLSVQDIRRIILDGGIVGMGGATFPTHVKLSPPAEKEIEYVILNGAECEPYLTSDHRLMIEQPDQIIAGLKIIMRVIDAKFGYIGIEDNKSEAIEVMEKVTKRAQYSGGSFEDQISSGFRKAINPDNNRPPGTFRWTTRGRRC